MRRFSLALLMVTLAFAASSASAQQGLAPAEDRPFSIQGGMGFSADPGGFMIGMEGDYRFHKDWSFAPRVRIAFDDDLVIVASTGNLRYWFDLTEMGASSPDFSPFLQTGIGASYIEKDDRRGDDDDTGFLLSLGGGVEARLTDELSLTSTMEFNIHPHDVLNENFFFTWEIAALRVRF
jgi:opacity protein-like surface antigen